jgi:uncharacterized protein (DUF488 family)
VSDLPIRTVGHGTLPAADFVDLVRTSGVGLIVDVRSYPGSRRQPHFAREQMSVWLPEAGIAYEWERPLGGRRAPIEGSPNVALRVDAFRGYADHMATDEFAAGVGRLLALAADRPAAVMCAESLWWRCHRRLLADALVLLRGVQVEHLFHDGRLAPHRPSPEARVDTGRLVYDLGTPSPLL